MSTIHLEAEMRTDIGKGASRRLRRLEDKVPAILYGGGQDPKMLHITHKAVKKALESESIYSSVFDLSVDGKKEKVILKSLQRHPYKRMIMHMDFQRVSAKDVLVKLIPIHFINEAEAPGIKEGGIANHTMSQVEVRCEAKYLPEFIEVDLKTLGLDESLHLSDLTLPKHVELTIDISDSHHDQQVISIHQSKLQDVEEELEAAAEEVTTEEANAGQDSTEAGSTDSTDSDDKE